MDVPMDSHLDDYFFLQLAPRQEENHWPPTANVITYELRDVEGRASQEAPALAVTNKAMRGNLQAEGKMEGQEEFSLDEAPHHSELEKVARIAKKTTKALEREKNVLQVGAMAPMIHDLEASEMGEWEELGIPREEFEGVSKARAE